MEIDIFLEIGKSVLLSPSPPSTPPGRAARRQIDVAFRVRGVHYHHQRHLRARALCQQLSLLKGPLTSTMHHSSCTFLFFILSSTVLLTFLIFFKYLKTIGLLDLSVLLETVELEVEVMLVESGLAASPQLRLFRYFL